MFLLCPQNQLDMKMSQTETSPIGQKEKERKNEKKEVFIKKCKKTYGN